MPVTKASPEPAPYRVGGVALSPELLLCLVNGQPCRLDLAELQAAPAFVLNLADTAKALGGISPRTVQRLVERGLLRPLKSIQRPLLFPVAEILRFIQTDLNNLDPATLEDAA